MPYEDKIAAHSLANTAAAVSGVTFVGSVASTRTLRWKHGTYEAMSQLLNPPQDISARARESTPYRSKYRAGGSQPNSGESRAGRRHLKRALWPYVSSRGQYWTSICLAEKHQRYAHHQRYMLQINSSPLVWRGPNVVCGTWICEA